MGVGIAATVVNVFTAVFLRVDEVTGAVTGISPFAMWTFALLALGLVLGMVKKYT